MYLKGYEGIIGNGIKKKNYFILPTCFSTKKVGIGRMPLPFFSNDETIEILFVDADRILKAYIQNKKDSLLIESVQQDG